MTHPGWCNRAHAAEWPNHTAELGELILTVDLSYAVELAQYGPDQPATVELYRHTGTDTTLTGLSLEDAARLARLLDVAVRTASEDPAGAEEKNPVVEAVATALRVLGAITYTNADSLLSLCVCELTSREREQVLRHFPDGAR